MTAVVPQGKTHLLTRETGLIMQNDSDRGPAPKRAKIDPSANGGGGGSSATLDQLKSLVTKLPDIRVNGGADRKRELKGWATTIVE